MIYNIDTTAQVADRHAIRAGKLGKLFRTNIQVRLYEMITGDIESLKEEKCVLDQEIQEYIGNKCKVY